MIASVTNGNGFWVEYAYDMMDRVTNIAWKTTSGATLGGFAYEYDAVGRIVSRSHELGDATHPSHLSQSSHATYAYDDLDRLASDGGVTYTYDAAGNRMTRTENGATVTYTLGAKCFLSLMPRDRPSPVPFRVCGFSIRTLYEKWKHHASFGARFPLHPEGEVSDSDFSPCLWG